MRQLFPRWGKVKPAAVLVDRIGVRGGQTLTRLGAKGQLVEPTIVRTGRSRWRRRVRSYAQRLPWGFVPHAPGDPVAVDTTPVEALPG